jgi:hypothetical protein
MNREGCGWKKSWLKLRYNPKLNCEGLKKAKETSARTGGGPLEYKAGVLIFW